MYTEKRPEKINTPEGWAHILPQVNMPHFRFNFDPVWQIIRSSLKGPILDAGCGRGDWVAFLAAKGFAVAGLDYSQEMIDSNRAAHPGLAWHVGTTQAMPFESGAFGGIISWGVIEHDPNGPVAALTEFRRVLRPGGRILVTVPVDSPYQRRASQNEFGEEGNFFQFFLTEQELAGFAQEAGFKILSTGPSSRPHPNLIWPERYARAGALQRKLLLLLAAAAPRRYANMIYCLAEA